MKLVETSFCTQLKEANLDNGLHISTENLQEGFNNTFFQSCFLLFIAINLRFEYQPAAITWLKTI